MTNLSEALKAAAERVRQMTPQERAEMYRAQRRSFMRAEASFGTDADERAYSRAVAHGDEKEIARLKADAEAQKKSIAPKKKRRVLDIFLDDNDVNEKAIVGFISFAMMVAFGIFDLITAMDGTPLEISDTIYTSFVVVTLGCFGISEAGKAFGK